MIASYRGAMPQIRFPSLPVIADCISFGFAIMVIIVLTVSNVVVTPPYAVSIVALYFTLRVMARQIRRNVRRAERAVSSA